MAMLRHHAVRCMGHVAGIDLPTHTLMANTLGRVHGLRELEPSNLHHPQKAERTEMKT